MRVIHFNKECSTCGEEVEVKRAKVTNFTGVFKREKENITLTNVGDIRYVKIVSLTDVKVMCWGKREIQISLKSSLETSIHKIVTHISNDELIIETTDEETRDGSALLEVMLPKWAFEEFDVNTTFGNISVARGVEAKILELVAETSGDIFCEACFVEGKFHTFHGNINLTVNPVRNVFVKVSVISGDVNIELLNTEAAIILSNTMCGKVSNSYKPNGNFLADISVSVMKGDINIK